jgi:predicted DNA-binding WGR domain protein
MRLENKDRSKGHYKYYQVDVCYDHRHGKYIVDATWGRIGNTGQHQQKAAAPELDDVLDQMEKVLLQKLFKRGYEMVDIQRWPESALSKDQDRFIDEDWD